MSNNLNEWRSDSFDFNDDLCQVILSYLSFEDKIRLESVSKQWQRLVYNSIDRFEYPFYKCVEYYWRLETKQIIKISDNFIQKFKFLKHLKLWSACDQKLLAIIADNCRGLQTLDYCLDNKNSIDDKVWQMFANNCGKSLQLVRIRQLNEENFNTESGVSKLTEYSEQFKRLYGIHLSIDSLKCFVLFKQFVDKFKHRITSLELRIKFNGEFNSFNELFEQISHFDRLKKLRLTIESKDSLEMDVKSFSELLAKSCPKLQSLSLEIRERIDLKNKILFKSLETLSCLQELELIIRSNGKPVNAIPIEQVVNEEIGWSALQPLHIELGSLSLLNNWKRLTELSLQYRDLNDNHLSDIHLYCPKLKSLSIKTFETLSDNSLYSLAKLNELNKLTIIGTPYRMSEITDSGVCALIIDCPQLNNIEFKCGITISDQTFEILKNLAESSPKRRIQLRYCWQRTEEQFISLDPNERFNGQSADRFWPILKQLPKNLTIFSREYFSGKCGTGRIQTIGLYRDWFKYSKEQIDDQRDGTDYTKDYMQHYYRH